MKVYELLTETKHFTSGEMIKAHGKTKEDRFDIFVRKAEKGEPFTVWDREDGPTREVIIDVNKSKEFLDVLRTRNTLEIKGYLDGKIDTSRGKDYWFVYTKGGEKLKLKNFVKDTSFGGTIKAPSESVSTDSNKQSQEKVPTDTQEAAAAVAIAIASMLNRKITQSDLTLENVKKAKSRYKTKFDSSPEEFVAVFNRPDWMGHFTNTANALIKHFPKAKNMIWYHGVGIAIDIRNKFHIVNNATGKRVFAEVNKWNPSDIWGAVEGFTLKGEDIDTLVEFNAFLDEQLYKNRLYGVSLKKNSKVTNRDSKVDLINFNDDFDELLDITIKELLLSTNNKLFKSKKAEIIYEAVSKTNAMVIRTFGGDTIAGEIKKIGSEAQHGKVSATAMNTMFKSMGYPPLTPANVIDKMIDHTALASKDYEKAFKKPADKIIELASKVNPETAQKARADFMTIAKTLSRGSIISKFQAVEVCSKIKQMKNDDDKETFIQMAIQYATSRSELSSAHIKIW